MGVRITIWISLTVGEGILRIISVYRESSVKHNRKFGSLYGFRLIVGEGINIMRSWIAARVMDNRKLYHWVL